VLDSSKRRLPLRMGTRKVLGAGDELLLRHYDHADDDAATIAFVPPGDTKPVIAKATKRKLGRRWC
jgi:hypothetical protein